MAQFDVILPALMQGKSVRREEWEPIVRMFVVDDILMCQCGSLSPWLHSLTWCEIIASDWQLVRAASAASEEHRTLAASPPGVSQQSLWNLVNKNGLRYIHAAFRVLSNWWEAE